MAAATFTVSASFLYQRLTGELPFRGNTRMLLHQVLHDEPRAPRRLNDHIPRDLETICLKAVAREPSRRYASARELADDLRHFLKGEPIRARPASRLERAWRWMRRRPAAAALWATGLLGRKGAAESSCWPCWRRLRRSSVNRAVNARGLAR